MPVHALVMELVDGVTLTEYICAQGNPGLPVAEALDVAGQIASALEAAHQKGIVHRDLKPANVKRRSDGLVKVLDFGLAKAFEADAAWAGAQSAVTSTGTRAGVVLGTTPYMSPEQARGLPIDARTDIWSFGCVLYEMLTGRMAFDGRTTSDVIAQVLEHEPDWSRLPKNTPAGVLRSSSDVSTRIRGGACATSARPGWKSNRRAHHSRKQLPAEPLGGDIVGTQRWCSERC